LLLLNNRHHNSGANGYAKQQLEKRLFDDIGRSGGIADYQRCAADGPHILPHCQNRIRFYIVRCVAAVFLPHAVLGPFIGVLVDRHSHKAVMILADMAIALAGGVLAVTALFTQLETWMIFAALFARSVGAAFHSPALSAATPLIVPAGMLVKYGG